MIKVTFKNPQSLFYGGKYQSISEIELKEITYSDTDKFNIVLVNNAFLHISKSYSKLTIKSIEHVKPTEL